MKQIALIALCLVCASANAQVQSTYDPWFGTSNVTSKPKKTLSQVEKLMKEDSETAGASGHGGHADTSISSSSMATDPLRHQAAIGDIGGMNHLIRSTENAQLSGGTVRGGLDTTH